MTRGCAADVSEAGPPVGSGHVAVAESVAGAQAVSMSRASLTLEAGVSACGFLHL